MHSAISASSNENQQPMTKLTRSSRQRSRTSSDSATRSQFRHTIARQIEANVEVLAEFRHARIARGRGADQRTRLRIELAEPQKIARQRGRKDGEITLHKAGREPRGRPAMAAPVSRA